MIKWFQQKPETEQDIITTEIAIVCILIYAAKIDGEYSDSEKKLIRLCLQNWLTEQNDSYFDKLINKCETMVDDSLQILHFTKKIKELEYSDRLSIIQMILEVIYSDKKIHEYEDNFIRRLAGLIYVEDKDIGDIKILLKKRLNL